MNSCHLEVEAGRPGPTALCVSSRPDEQLDSLEEAQLSANKSGSFLCVYSLSSINYTQDPNADSLCPRLPGPPSPSSATSENVDYLGINVTEDTEEGLHGKLETVTGRHKRLTSLRAVMLSFRFITGLLLHTLIALVISGLLFVCGVLWWLHCDYTSDLSVVLDTERDNRTCLLGFAVVSTTLTAVLLVLTFVLRKLVKLAVELLRVTKKAIDRCPFLLLQPLWTVAGLLFWVLWVAVLLSLGTAGAAQVTGGSQVEYLLLSGIRRMWGYHPVGLVRTSEFILACQQMAVAGTVVACYFNRRARATAVNGTDFCTSAKDAGRLFSHKSRHFTCVNCLGDVIIFLGKVLVACLTALGGLVDFNYRGELQVWAAPLLLVACLASLMVQCFVSVPAVLGALLPCSTLDLETNDGSSEKPYFMDRELLSVVERINKLNGTRTQRDRCSARNEEGSELRPIGRGVP